MCHFKESQFELHWLDIGKMRKYIKKKVDQAILMTNEKKKKVHLELCNLRQLCELTITIVCTLLLQQEE